MLVRILTKRLMLVGHTSDVQRDMTVVLYALMTEMIIDVGKLIFSQLSLSIHNSNLALYFPTIVTKLCARTGVIFQDDNEWLQSMKAIDRNFQ